MRFLSCCLLAALALTLSSVSAQADNPDQYLDKTVEQAIRSLGQPTGRMTMGSTELLTFERLELTAEDGVITTSRRIKAAPTPRTPPARVNSGKKLKPDPEASETEEPPEEQVQEEVDWGPSPVLSSRQQRRLARRSSGAVSTNNPALMLPRMETDRERPSIIQSTPAGSAGPAVIQEERLQYERPVFEVDRDKPSVLQNP